MLEYTLFLVGLFLLVKSANYLVEGASTLAYKLKTPPIIIGLTIVAFGTSMPELIINIVAALKGSTEVAFGNIIGSNIANILLVLGVTAIISPIKVQSTTIKKEIPFAILSVVVLFVVSNYFLIDKIQIGILTKVAGIILLLFFFIFFYYVIDLSKKSKKKIEKKELSIIETKPLITAVKIIGGLVGLFIGGQWVVNGAVNVASQLGLSEYLISATIIALGTSLPELVTSIQAVRKTEPGLAIGNVVGSNIFNIFWILGVTALIAPIVIPGFINTDIFILGAASILLFIMLIIKNKYVLGKKEGIILVAGYVVYITFLIIRG